MVDEQDDFLSDPTESGADNGDQDENEDGSGGSGESKDDQGKNDESAGLKAELAAIKQQNQELLDRIARAATPAPVAAKPDDEADDDEPEADDEDPEKLADELTKNGIKALQKRGFVRAKDVEKIAERIAERKIASERQKITAEASVLAPYTAELNDPKSPLRAKTAQYFEEMVKADPKLKDSPAALAMAAGRAKAELAAEGNRNEATEGERQNRIARQAGDAGKRGGDGRSQFSGNGGSDDSLSAEDLATIRGMGISQKDFLESRRQIRNGGGMNAMRLKPKQRSAGGR